jgi:hypothetical protein
VAPRRADIPARAASGLQDRHERFRFHRVHRNGRRPFQARGRRCIIGRARHYRDAAAVRREAVTLPTGGAATRFVITRREA